MRKISRKINIDRDPDDERDLFLTDSIEFTPGVTVLVGCNGFGKTTVINYIEDTLFNKNIPFMKFDNVRNGGSRFIEMAMMFDNIDYLPRRTMSDSLNQAWVSSPENDKAFLQRALLK